MTIIAHQNNTVNNFKKQIIFKKVLTNVRTYDKIIIRKEVKKMSKKKNNHQTNEKKEKLQLIITFINLIIAVIGLIKTVIQ